MVLICKKMLPNPFIGFAVDPAATRFVGHDLPRPEGILARRDAALWAAEARGGAMHICPDGSQKHIAPADDSEPGKQTANMFEGTLPNGLAFARNGDPLIATHWRDR